MSEQPLVTVARGNPTAAELAAVVAVLAGLASARRPAPGPTPVLPGWLRPARFRPAGAWNTPPGR